LLGRGKAAFRLRAYLLLVALPVVVLLFYEPPLADRVLDFGRTLRLDGVAAEQLQAIAQDAGRPAHERFGALAEAQRLLGEPPEEALLALRPLLAHEDPDVRGYMTRLVGTSKAPDADDLLLAQLAGDPSTDVRRTVAAVIAGRVQWYLARGDQTPARRLRGGLERACAEDPSPRVRRIASQVLAAVGEP
jgi:hypothetical protein